MTSCGVLGCDSQSKKHPHYKFHRLPLCPATRDRWLRLLGPPESLARTLYVCSKHFEPRCYGQRGSVRVLKRSAVPTLCMPKIEHPDSEAGPPVQALPSAGHGGYHFVRKIAWLRKKLEQARRSLRFLRGKQRKTMMIKTPPKTQSKDITGTISVCRVCLAADVPLYGIKETGMEDAFMDLTGAPYSSQDGLPSHLCCLCRAELSKCVSFRDRCQRSQELLETLKEWGPLKMKDIASIDRYSHKLTRNLTRADVYTFNSNETNNYVDFTPGIQENICFPSKVTKFETKEDKIAVSNKVFNSANEIEIKTEVSIENINENNDTIIDNVEKKEFPIDDDFESTESAVLFKETNFEISHEGMIECDDGINMLLDNCDDNASEITDNEKEELIGSFDVTVSTKSKITGNTRPSKRQRPRRNIINGESYPKFDYKAFEKECKVKIKLLTIEEQKQEIELLKTGDNYLKCPFSCDLCGKGYNHQESYNNHMTYHDPSIGPYECQICHCYCATNRKLQKHGDRHRVMFTCQECGHVTKGEKTVARAHYSTHTGKSHACPHCGNVYLRKTSLFNHMRVTHPTKNIACDECGETFLSARGVSYHKILGHRLGGNDTKTDLKCKTCAVLFSSAGALERHALSAADATHRALRPCAACGENCRDDEQLATHKLQCTPTEGLYCKECDKTFLSAASFDKHHRRKHLNERYTGFRSTPYRSLPDGVVCEICGKVVKSAISLKIHLLRHQGIKPFSCTKCPKTFSSKVQLEWHTRTHTGEMPFQCDICQRQFNLLGNMKRHIKTVHLGERRYTTCDLCGKTLSTPSCLKLHIRTVHHNMPQPRRKRRRPKKEAAAAELAHASD